MLKHSDYSDLINVPYRAGVDDCYGLIRKVYNRCFGIEMPNYARPLNFAESGLNLIALILNNPNFIQKGMHPKFLNDGDVLFFRCASTETNHLGVYVGNGLFLHHQIDHIVKEENLDQRWLKRLTHVAYHTDVELPSKKVLLSDFLPEHFKPVGESYDSQ